MIDIFLRMKVTRLIRMLEKEFGGEIKDWGRWPINEMGWYVGKMDTPSFWKPSARLEKLERKSEELEKQLLDFYQAPQKTWCLHIYWHFEPDPNKGSTGWRYTLPGRNDFIWADLWDICPREGCHAKKPEKEKP